LWLLLQVSPVRNEKELVVLLLIVVKDITALRQPIDEDSYSAGSIAHLHASQITHSCSTARIQQYTLIILRVWWPGCRPLSLISYQRARALVLNFTEFAYDICADLNYECGYGAMYL